MEVKERMIYNIVKLRRLFLFLLLGTMKISYAQQEPVFVQYNFNTQVINPAYAGTWDNLGFLVLGRQQWAGMDGAPRTFTFSVQSPTRFNNVALGLNIITDRAGFERRTLANVDYSYRLQLNRENYLRLGIKAGITNYSVNFSDYIGYPGDPADPVFAGDPDSKLLLNFGIGAYYYSEDYYLGLSVPKILKNDFDYNYNNYSTTAELQHIFLIGGYIYEISEDVKFKPTFLTRFVWGAPFIFDLSANFLLREKVWLGANYRWGDSFGLVAQWIFDNRLRIGYGVELSTSRLRSFHSGTHEVMVSYELGSLRKWSSPRMF